MEERYLGDGVYASFDGSGVIRLEVKASPGSYAAQIDLEFETLKALDKYRDDIASQRIHSISAQDPYL